MKFLRCNAFRAVCDLAMPGFRSPNGPEMIVEAVAPNHQCISLIVVSFSHVSVLHVINLASLRYTQNVAFVYNFLLSVMGRSLSE